MASGKLSMNPRSAGILVPVFSLRGENDLGIGDVACLKEFVDLSARLGYGFVQLLPINETGPDNSPYNAISSVALEPMTLDCSLTGLDDLQEQFYDEICDPIDLAGLRDGPVKYPEVRKLKHKLLRSAFAHFLENVYEQIDARSDEFKAFCEAEGNWLNDYCVFRMLMDREGGSQVWEEWDKRYNTHEKALAFITELFQEDPEEADREAMYYAYVQWIAYEQWNKLSEYAHFKGVDLMGDIPIGVSLASVDVFGNKEIFNLDWYGGAPPEKLFKDDEFVQKWGQNWGIPLYNWEALKVDGYQWWKQRVKKTTEIFHLFRIDHTLGFYRIYSFPWNPVRNDEFLPLSEEDAAKKCQGRLPGFRPRDDDSEKNRKGNRLDGERYLRMIKETAGRADVIAEDLGVVPDYVRPSLEKLGIPGMKVPQWEFTDGAVTSGLQYPAVSFATYATHDHAPMKSQWEDAKKKMAESKHESPEWWEARNFLQTLCHFAGYKVPDKKIPDWGADLQYALLKHLSFSNSERIAIMITDLLDAAERINVPGVMDGSNWSYRIDATVAELSDSDEWEWMRDLSKKVLNETSRVPKVVTM